MSSSRAKCLVGMRMDNAATDEEEDDDATDEEDGDGKGDDDDG